MTTSSTKDKHLKKWQICLYPLPAVVFLMIWHVFTYNNQQRQFIFSSPDQVWSALCRTSADGELWRNSVVTIYEAICGFVLGTTIGAFGGLSLWYSRTVALIAQPYITALATIPIFAL